MPLPDGKIGVLDSGIGGTTTLRALRKLLPNENFLYFGDSKNCPYGEKTDEELLGISQKNVERLLKENVKLIVVACNTLTTRVLKKLRQIFPDVLFVGTEPAVKPALEAGAKTILILSTPATADYLKQTKFPSLGVKPVASASGSSSDSEPESSGQVLRQVASRSEPPSDSEPEPSVAPSSFAETSLPTFVSKTNQAIFNVACSGLAVAIESRDAKKIDACLEAVLAPLSSAVREEIELVVLGCTHYPIILDRLKPLFPSARFIDGNAGVATQTLALLSKNSLLSPSKTAGLVEYVWT